MTLAVAYIRKLTKRRASEELVVASDSRLRGGQCLDFGQKVFPLARSDALVAFTGDTDYAYPLVQHLTEAVRIYPRSVDRRLPLSRARGHFLSVFNQLHSMIHSLPVGTLDPIPPSAPVEILFAGYAWHEHKFRIWKLAFDETRKRFTHEECGRFCFIGDRQAVKEATECVSDILTARGVTQAEIADEPFEVLRAIIVENKYASIGGAPQAGKVYRHMNSQMFSVLWPQGDRYRPHVYGRPLLQPEHSSLPILDPDTMNWAAHSANMWDMWRFENGVRIFEG